MGRSQKALRNVITGVGNKLLLMILAFATRTLFIKLLGAEYTGVSSLYTNILSVLSLAELGLGNVLMFYLYSALKEKDENKICCLVNEFKKIYQVIIIVVLSIGIALIPFLGFIINSDLNYKEVILYYCLYLINSVASYFVVYRTMVIAADQNGYISNIVSSASTICMYILQIVYLLIFKSFIGYLIIQVLCTIMNNLVLNQIALRKYPFLKNNKTFEGSIIDKKDLFKNIKATFLFKISDTILDQTDSIIISIMFGTVFVGYYYNYFLLITFIVAIAGIIANGLVASIGNLVAEGNTEQSYKMLRLAMLAFAIFGTICTSCYASIVQEFIPVWIGPEYVKDYSWVIAILCVFYLRMVTNTMWMYRSAMGLFKEVQYINLIAALLNIVLSIILGMWIGLPGVIVATAISRLLTSFWYEGKVLFKKLNKSVMIYYGQQLKDFLICIVSVVVCVSLSNLITVHGWLGIIIKLCSSFFISLLIEIVVYYRTEELKMMKSKILSVFRR